MASHTVKTTAASLSDEVVAAYRQDGFVHLPGVVAQEDLPRFRQAALGARESVVDYMGGSQIFAQLLQVWKTNDDLRALTFDQNVAEIAVRLAGVPLRLWHDQELIKAPHNGAATEFHQDEPYWPHAHSRHALSAWIALVDVPVERGAMSFIPGSQHSHRGLRPHNLADVEDFFLEAPHLRWHPRVTIPLRAGDCTFHNSYTAHTANSNSTDEPRVAHVTIYVDADLTYTGAPHVCTDGLSLVVGDTLPDDEFPRLPRG